MTAAVSEAMRGALADWRRDGLLLCLLPVFCWPAVVAAVLTRPAALVVLLSPVVLGVRELLAARWAGRALRDPAVRWTPYEAVVVRRGWLPPVLVLEGHGDRLSLGLLGRRVLPPGPPSPADPSPADPIPVGPIPVGPTATDLYPVGPCPGDPRPGAPRDPGDPRPRTGAVRVLLAGDLAVGAILWVPVARRLGRARPARAQPWSRVSR